MLVEEGKEYSLKDKAGWETLALSRGDIVEIYLPGTNLECRQEFWAGFWVKQPIIKGSGDYLVVAKSLGCSASDWAKFLSNSFNRKKGTIHLCVSTPCGSVEDCTMHATRLRVFSPGAFERPYMGHYIKKQMQKWEEEELSDCGDDGIDVSGELPRREIEESAEWQDLGDEVPPRDPRPHVARGGDKGAAEEAPAGEGKKAMKNKKVLEEEDRAKLRARLALAREKMLARGPPTPAGGDTALGHCEDTPLVESSSPGYSASEPAEDGEAVKDELIDLEKDQKKVRKVSGRKDKKKKRREGRDAKRVHGDHSEVLALEDTKGNTTKNLQGQLVKIAAATAKEKAQKNREEKKKHQKKDPSHQLARILTLAVGKQKKKRSESSGSSQGGQKKKKKKGKSDKKKKKRKRKPQGSSPGGSSGSSQMTSSDRDFEEDSSSSSSRRKLDPPLARKSKRRPGSVLAMLLEHARSQLDQNAKVSVASEEALTLSSGVKLASYFAIVVRPQLGGAMAQTRELHHIAQAIDLLRCGNLDTLGDLLAGRFMSLHQSVLDGSWNTARHLELRPLEDGSAAGPAVVLAAKKHTRMAAKVAPGDYWTWPTGGKAKGGRGRSEPWTEGGSPGKGKGKKGGKGKGKGKTWSGGEKEFEGKPKEKIPEK
jgi:hypothetical protein